MAVMFFEDLATARALEFCTAIGAESCGTGGAAIGDDMAFDPPLQSKYADNGQNHQ